MMGRSFRVSLVLALLPPAARCGAEGLGDPLGGSLGNPVIGPGLSTLDCLRCSAILVSVA